MNDFYSNQSNRSLDGAYYSRIGFFKEYAAICIKSGTPRYFKKWARLSTGVPLISLPQRSLNYKLEDEYRSIILKEIIQAFSNTVIKGLCADINMGAHNSIDNKMEAIIKTEIEFQADYYSKLLIERETVDLSENKAKIKKLLIHIEHIKLRFMGSGCKGVFGMDLKMEYLKAYNLIKSIFYFRFSTELDSDASLNYFIDYYLNMLIYLKFNKEMNIFDFFNFKAFGEIIDTATTQNEQTNLIDSSIQNNCSREDYFKYRCLADCSKILNYYLSMEEYNTDFIENRFPLGNKEKMLYNIWHLTPINELHYVLIDSQIFICELFNIKKHVIDNTNMDHSIINEQIYNKDNKRQLSEERCEPRLSTCNDKEKNKKESLNRQISNNKRRRNLEKSASNESNETYSAEEINSKMPRIGDRNDLKYSYIRKDDKTQQNNIPILSIDEILNENPKYKYKDIYNQLKGQGYLRHRKYYGSFESLNIPSFKKHQDYNKDDIFKLNLIVYILSFHQFYFNCRAVLYVLHYYGCFDYSYDIESRLKLINYLQSFHLPIKEIIESFMEILEIFKSVILNIKKLDINCGDYDCCEISDDNYDKVTIEELVFYITVKISGCITKFIEILNGHIDMDNELNENCRMHLPVGN